jgi:putative ABC transport system permease protein
VHAAVSVSTIVVAAVASIVVGITFGLYPALRASRLSPIDAIRHE